MLNDNMINFFTTQQHETALEIARRKNLSDIIHIIENPPSLLVSQPRLQGI